LIQYYGMDIVSSRHVTWTDAENPTEDHIRSLQKKHPIHPLVLHELQAVTYRPKIEEYDDHLFLVLHFPVFDERERATRSRELDFVIFPYHLITVHYDPLPQLGEFQEMLGGHEAIRERRFGINSSILLHSIVSHLFRLSLDELESIDQKVRKIEKIVFDKEMSGVLTDIAEVRRDILSFRKALKPQGRVLESLAERGKKFFGADFAPYFNDIRTEYIQLWNEVEDLQENLDVLYETHVSLVSLNSNEVMKTLTIMASLLLPATLIASIYGMNVKNAPLHGFWSIVGLITVAVFVIYRYFKHRRWL